MNSIRFAFLLSRAALFLFVVGFGFGRVAAYEPSDEFPSDEFPSDSLPVDVDVDVDVDVNVDVDPENALSSSFPYQNPINGFDYATSYHYLLYAYAAIANTSDLLGWSCNRHCVDTTEGMQVTDVFYNQKYDSHGYLGFNANNQEIVLSFRGTNSFTNFITDIAFWKNKAPFAGLSGAYVATGFYQAYASLRSQVIPAVQKLIRQFPDYQLVITGHSLGGAMGTMAALELSVRYQLSPMVFTYGSPRVGNSVFSHNFNKYVESSQRMTNGADSVPHLPPQWVDFEHVRNEVWFNPKTGKFNRCDDAVTEDPNCSNSQSLLKVDIRAHLNYMNLNAAEF